MLAELLCREQLPPGASVLDLGTGSGVLAVAAARSGAARVLAVDVSRRATLTARANALLNRVRVETRRGDLFEPLRGERFDAIVSNPPYLPGSEPAGTRGAARAWEGGSRGRALIDRIIAGVAGHLKPGGVLLLVHSSVCDIAATLDELTRRGLRANVAARHTGPPGPLLAARRPLLEREELVVVRATRA